MLEFSKRNSTNDKFKIYIAQKCIIMVSYELCANIFLQNKISCLRYATTPHKDDLTESLTTSNYSLSDSQILLINCA